MAEEEKVDSESGGEKKSKAILFVVIGIVLVLLILIGLVVLLMMSGGDQNDTHGDGKVETHQEQMVQPTAQPTRIVVGNTVSVRTTDKFSPGLIYPAEGPIAFTVNLMTQTGKRYLKTSLQFEIEKDELKAAATKAELDRKMPMLKDAVIDILSSKSLEDIATTKGKNRVKDEVVKRINEFLIDGQVFDVFFLDFVVS